MARSRTPVTIVCLVAAGALAASAPVLRAGAGQDASFPAARDKSIYGHVAHLGWVVRDLDATVAAWRRLGVTDITEPRVEASRVIYRDRPVTARLRTAAARFSNGEVFWIQPLNAGTAYADFLARRGEGVHHVAFSVPDAGRLESELAHFKAHGVGVVQGGTWDATAGTGHFAYLDTAGGAGGLTVALEHDPDHKRSPPASENDEPFRTITQYAFVVRDIAAVGRYLAGIGLGDLRVEKNVSLDRRLRGQPGVFEMLLGWGRGADIVFEWIEPTAGPSVYHEHLARSGEGFHHLGFNTTDMDAAIARLRDRGLEVTMSGGWNSNGHEGRFAYLDADKHGGVAIELLWNKPRR